MIGKLYLTFVPAIGVSCFLLMLIASESLAARPSYYTGGIALPYISDTWRDAPNYYLGLVGGIICGACLLVQHAYLNVRIAFACGDKRASILWLTASALGALSCIGLLGLTIFSTTAFPDLHQYSAYLFFVLQAIALPLFTAAAALPGDMLKRASIRGGHAHFGAMTKPADTSAYGGAAGAASAGKIYCPSCFFQLKLGSTILFWLSFIVYLPVGIAIVCTWYRVPLDKCKGELGLGDAYCDALVLPADYNGTDCADGPCTQLWEYDGCPAINEMRAACQLVCVLALLFFHWSFVGENRKLLSAGSTSTVGAEVVIEA